MHTDAREHAGNLEPLAPGRCPPQRQPVRCNLKSTLQHAVAHSFGEVGLELHKSDKELVLFVLPGHHHAIDARSEISEAQRSQSNDRTLRGSREGRILVKHTSIDNV